MRAGLPLSILMHAAVGVAGYVAFPSTMETLESASVIVPIEIVEISDTTNLRATPPTPEPTPDPETAPEPEPEEPEPEEDQPPEPDPDELIDDEEVISEDDQDIQEKAQPDPEPEPEDISEDETADEPEDAPEPEEDKAKPPQEEKPKLSDGFLNSILQDAEAQKQKRTQEREAKKAADLKKVEDANRSQRSVGDRERDTATWTDMLKSKIETRCYRDASDMANADRLQVTYEITFNRDGSLLRPPKRVRPVMIPGGDQQMRIFDINAVRAIQKCAPYNDIFPPEHYEEWKDFTFVFGKTTN